MTAPERVSQHTPDVCDFIANQGYDEVEVAGDMKLSFRLRATFMIHGFQRKPVAADVVSDMPGTFPGNFLDLDAAMNTADGSGQRSLDNPSCVRVELLSGGDRALQGPSRLVRGQELRFGDVLVL